MRLKKPLVKVTLSFADQKRVAMFCQILMNVDKRINRSQPEQKKAKSKQRCKISSLKKRACLFGATLIDDVCIKQKWHFIASYCLTLNISIIIKYEIKIITFKMGLYSHEEPICLHSCAWIGKHSN